MALPFDSQFAGSILKDLDFNAVVTLFGGMEAAYKSNKRLRDRIKAAASSPEKLARELQFFNAQQQTWGVNRSKFRFEEVEDFSLDIHGKKMVWSGHSDDSVKDGSGGSKPHRLLKVFMIQEDGSELELPLNVGFSSKSEPNRRIGGGHKLAGRLLKKDGGLPRLALVSAYVQDGENALISGQKEVIRASGEVVPAQVGLKKTDIRGKVETALIQLLKACDHDVVLSSMLFNIRDNPLKGVLLALTGLYAKGAHTVLPLNGVFNVEKREALTHTKNARDKKNNAVFWAAYLNEATMDLSKLPNLNLDPLIGAEMQIAAKSPSIQTMGEWYNRLANFINASYGKAPLHDVAKHGMVQFLPRNVLNESALLSRKNAGRGFSTVMHNIVSSPDRDRLQAAAAHETAKHLNVLLSVFGKDSLVFQPKKVINQKDSAGNVIKTREIIRLDAEATLKHLNMFAPAEYGIGKEQYILGYDDALGLCYKSRSSDSILRMPGKPSQLKYLPAAMLSEKTLLVRDSRARTPLHYIAENSELDLIPASLFTKKMLICQDGAGRTPLSIAVKTGCLQQLPQEFLSKKLLTSHCTDCADVPKSLRSGTWTLVDLAAYHGTLDKLPKELLFDISGNKELQSRLLGLAARGLGGKLPDCLLPIPEMKEEVLDMV